MAHRAQFHVLWQRETDPWIASMAVALQEPLLAALLEQDATSLTALLDLFLTTVAGGRLPSPPS
jgi:hypothetical protein